VGSQPTFAEDVGSQLADEVGSQPTFTEEVDLTFTEEVGSQPTVSESGENNGENGQGGVVVDDDDDMISDSMVGELDDRRQTSSRATTPRSDDAHSGDARALQLLSAGRQLSEAQGRLLSAERELRRAVASRDEAIWMSQVHARTR
jgi:hypothetical protein